MGSGFYRFSVAAFSIARAPCIRELVIGQERANRKGPLILAVTHISHLEPAFVSSHVRRHIRWMARVEFYKTTVATTLLNWCGAFPVDRYGNAAPAVRNAIRLLRSGEVVGIFPEGGCATGRESALRAGPIKSGACTISIATGVPVVPVVVLGTETLNRVPPWLPTKSGRIWIAFGDEVLPPQERMPRKQARLEMTPRIAVGFVRTYQDLLTRAGLRDDQVP